MQAGKTYVEGLAVTVNRYRLVRRSFDVVALVIRQRQAEPEVRPQTLLADQVALVALYNQRGKRPGSRIQRYREVLVSIVQSAGSAAAGTAPIKAPPAAALIFMKFRRFIDSLSFCCSQKILWRRMYTTKLDFARSTIQTRFSTLVRLLRRQAIKMRHTDPPAARPDPLNSAIDQNFLSHWQDPLPIFLDNCRNVVYDVAM